MPTPHQRNPIHKAYLIYSNQGFALLISLRQIPVCQFIIKQIQHVARLRPMILLACH